MPPRRLPVDILSIPRETFLTGFWNYHRGDHVTVLAPTGGGKTWLSLQLLSRTVSEDLPAVILVMKPRDSTVDKFARDMRLRIVRDWPPSRIRTRISRPVGWALWPTETADPDADDRRHRVIFQRCLRERYRTAARHPNIVFADETYSLEHELSLEADLRRIWTKGRSIGCGLLAASQRPVWISRWALQAQHLFLGHDPDRDMQRRYGEIGGGIDPDVVRDAVRGLGQHEFLYIDRDQRAMCIVER